jgi:hypothetical protein
MTNLRRDLPPLPDYMNRLPLDERGYPVPWFVAWIEGKPDFRIVRNINDIPAEVVAHRGQQCWICGRRLGAYRSFVVGPMCAVNLTSGEPPSHLSCATFAAKACPFLARPKAKRREANMPEDGVWKGGGLERNPGVAMVWTTKSYEMHIQEGSAYFLMGPPDHVEFWAESAPAPRQKVVDSIESGLPLLIPMLLDTGHTQKEIDKMVEKTMKLVPE